MVDPTKRPRGILTSSDRELLLGLVEYNNKQQYSNRRGDIRERIANALLDFSLLQYSLRDRDRKRVFQDTAGEAGVDEAQFPECIRSMLSWTYLGLKEQEYDFESLLAEAVEEAEAEYTRKYLNTGVDISVNFNVDVTRTNDLSELLSRIESGEPVPANRLYDLLQLSDGVPIDTDNLSTVRVWFKSSYPKGEKAVLETLFAEYLGVDVDIVDAESRVDPEELGIEKDSAVIEPTSSSPDPSKIKNKPSLSSSISDETIEEIREQEMERRIREGGQKSDKDNSSKPDEVFNEVFEGDYNLPLSIASAIGDGSMENVEVTPDNVAELFDSVRERIISTQDIAVIFDCSPDAARSALSNISDLESQLVLDNNQDQLEVWSKVQSADQK
jgi:hypothetical protein